jgi:hypothetical protein
MRAARSNSKCDCLLPCIYASRPVQFCCKQIRCDSATQTKARRLLLALVLHYRWLLPLPQRHSRAPSRCLLYAVCKLRTVKDTCT